MSEPVGEPAIWPTIRRGIDVANGSWPGMACFAVGCVTLGVLVMGSLIATGMPAVPEPSTAATPVSRAVAPQPQQSTATATTPGAVVEQSVASQSQQPVASATPSDAATQSAAPADASTAAQNQAVYDWMRKAWPVVLALLAVVVIWFTWLQAGQLAYVTKRVRGADATLGDYWRDGWQVWAPALGGAALMLLMMGSLAFGIEIAPRVIRLAAARAPNAAIGSLVTLLLVAVEIALLVALTVCGTRLAFWLVAIVADGRGPVEGMRVSWRLTRGRFRRTIGLLLALAIVTLAAHVPFWVLRVIATAVGGSFGSLLLTVTQLGSFLVTTVYLGFVSAASVVRFYDDLKSASAPSPLPAP